MENRDLQGSWGGATVRQDYAMMMMMVENYDDTLSRFHTIPACHGQTDRRTDGQNYYINIARQQQYADAR